MEVGCEDFGREEVRKVSTFCCKSVSGSFSSEVHIFFVSPALDASFHTFLLFLNVQAALCLAYACIYLHIYLKGEIIKACRYFRRATRLV